MGAYYGIKRLEARHFSHELADARLQLRMFNKRKPFSNEIKNKERLQKIELLQKRIAQIQQILWDMDTRPLHKKMQDKTMLRRRLDIGFRV